MKILRKKLIEFIAKKQIKSLQMKDEIQRKNQKARPGSMREAYSQNIGPLEFGKQKMRNYIGRK